MTNILKVIERLSTPDRGLPPNRRTVNVRDIESLVEDWRRLDMTVRGPHMDSPLIDATDPNEVVIAFGGPQACGKTLMSNFISVLLREQGFEVLGVKVEQRLDDVLRVRNVPATISERLATAEGVTDIEAPEPRSVWRHTSGRLYRVEEITNREPGRQDRYPTTVVYRNVKNGEPYNRKLVDWHRSMTLVQTADDPDNVVNSDREGFMIEAAEQHGFVATNEDGTTFSCTQDNIIALLTAAYGPRDRPHYVNADPAVVEKTVETIKAANPPVVLESGPSTPVATERWYLGAMNDGLFIIDTPPRTSTEGGPYDWPDGPAMVLALNGLSSADARAIVDAHNATLKAANPPGVLESDTRSRPASYGTTTTPFPLGPGETITMSGIGLGERPASINNWIDDQIRRNEYAQKEGVLRAADAAEIARGAVLHMIADKAALITNLANEVHAANVKAGWWTDLKTGEDLHGKRNVGELLCLVHSELSEAIDGTDESDTVLYRLRKELAKVWTGVGAQRDHLLAVHQSISRAMEGHRKSLMDDKLPHRPTFRVELVDALIRLLDILGADNREHPAGTIFVEKRAFNASRLDHTPEHRRQAGGKGY